MESASLCQCRNQIVEQIESKMFLQRNKHSSCNLHSQRSDPHLMDRIAAMFPPTRIGVEFEKRRTSKSKNKDSKGLFDSAKYLFPILTK